MLRDEFEHYLCNQAKYAEKYEGKVLVIKEKSLVGVYDNENEALRESSQKYELGSFLIQPCSADPESVVSHIPTTFVDFEVEAAEAIN